MIKAYLVLIFLSYAACFSGNQKEKDKNITITISCDVISDSASTNGFRIPAFTCAVLRAPSSLKANAITYNILKNLDRPQPAVLNRVEGTIKAEFIVDETGKVGNAKILEGIKKYYGCNAEVIKAINLLPAFEITGKMNGRPAKTRFTISVRFG